MSLSLVGSQRLPMYRLHRIKSTNMQAIIGPMISMEILVAVYTTTTRRMDNKSKIITMLAMMIIRNTRRVTIISEE